MRPFALFVLCLVMLALFAQPAVADDIGPPAGGLIMLTVGSLFVSGANLIAITMDGSTFLGIAGVAVGIALAVYAPIADTGDDEGVLVGIGIATALLGVADIAVARGWWHDPELMGMRVQPAMGTSDGERWYGLQFTSH